MPDPHNRAQQNLNMWKQFTTGLLNGWKQQIDDATRIASQALKDKKYPPEQVFPDLLALWINGASLMRDAMMGGPAATPPPTPPSPPTSPSPGSSSPGK
jgi:hypothetical protein